MGDAPDHEEGAEAVSREPEFGDIASLCRELNNAGAKYVLVGGFAIILHGFPRYTADIDFLIEAGVENETKVLDILSSLPDHAAREIQAGEVDRYGVVRVGDEIMVDLMKSGCGITYADAIKDAVIKDVQGVPVPVASHATLWKMKQTVREKDVPDRLFLVRWASENGITLVPAPASSSSHQPLPQWLVKAAQWIDKIIRRSSRT